MVRVSSFAGTACSAHTHIDIRVAKHISVHLPARNLDALLQYVCTLLRPSNQPDAVLSNMGGNAPSAVRRHVSLLRLLSKTGLHAVLNCSAPAVLRTHSAICCTRQMIWERHDRTTGGFLRKQHVLPSESWLSRAPYPPPLWVTLCCSPVHLCVTLPFRCSTQWARCISDGGGPQTKFSAGATRRFSERSHLLELARRGRFRCKLEF